MLGSEVTEAIKSFNFMLFHADAKLIGMTGSSPGVVHDDFKRAYNSASESIVGFNDKLFHRLFPEYADDPYIDPDGEDSYLELIVNKRTMLYSYMMRWFNTSIADAFCTETIP